MNYKTHTNVYIYNVTFYEDNIGIHNHFQCKRNLLKGKCSLDCSYKVSAWLAAPRVYMGHHLWTGSHIVGHMQS